MSLMGSFDCDFAYALAQTILEGIRLEQRVLVSTDCLEIIDPGAKNVLENLLSDVAKDLSRILFTGQNAELIAPKGSVVIF